MMRGSLELVLYCMFFFFFFFSSAVFFIFCSIFSCQRDKFTVLELSVSY